MVLALLQLVARFIPSLDVESSLTQCLERYCEPYFERAEVSGSVVDGNIKAIPQDKLNVREKITCHGPIEWGRKTHKFGESCVTFASLSPFPPRCPSHTTDPRP